MLKSLRRKSAPNGGQAVVLDTFHQTGVSYVSVPTKEGTNEEKKGKSSKWRQINFRRNTSKREKNDLNVCYMDESPVILHKVAANGNLNEFERLYAADPKRLGIQDSKGQAPVHLAAAKGRLKILDFIAEHNGDLNIQNKHGNTPLHIAVEARQNDSIDFLIDHGANTTILNNLSMGPIHMAVDAGESDVLKTLLKHDEVDPNLRGEFGGTCLHYAAAKDRDECAKILLEYGAKPCAKCNYGYYPIHLAAKAAAARTLEVLIQNAISHGYKREEILSFTDKENNMPLHSAVHGGNIKAVEVCLKAGAPVNAQQEDKSTPLHFACAQGNLEMVTMMFDMQPGNFECALHSEDVVRMTPLHRAALFNHATTVAYLIHKGADVNAKDGQERTPLLLAASKGGWNTVQCLLENKANIAVKDHNNRNFLHLAIKFGGKLNQFSCSFIKDLKKYLNEKDDLGCTPLHYASKEGHLLALDDLIKMGAVINLKNNHKQSPFHFAARYGRLNTCKRLLESGQGVNIINETDEDDQTALHIAAANGHTKVISLLLQKGAVVTRDNNSNTALHFAASNGYTQSMRILLGVHANLLEMANIEGETALHLASKNGKANSVNLLMTMGASFTKNKDNKTFMDYTIENKLTEVAMSIISHDRWQEVMNLCSITYGCPMLGLIKQLPEVCMAVLDRCQSHSHVQGKSKNYYIEYNFKYLRCPLEAALEKKKNGEDFTPMLALNDMVKNGRVECLSHPVCVNFLQMKWNRYGKWFYLFYLLVYTAYLSLLTAFVVNHESLKHHDDWEVDNDTAEYLFGNKDGGYKFSPWYTVCLWIIALYSIINILKEVFQMITQRFRYFLDLQNFLEWFLYVTNLLFVFPFLFGISTHWQWQAGALAVFLAWFNCLVFLQRFDFFGIYVVMFLEILKTLVQVLCVFSILFIAFGLSFFILMYAEESEAYETPGISIMRTAMMMLEPEYIDNFSKPFTDDKATTLHFSNLTLVLLGGFVLLMPIILINLLIGLAVGDIESVQRNARLKRLAMQVELHTDMERKMPSKLMEKVDSEIFRVYPNKCRSTLHLLMSMVMAYDDKSRSYFHPFTDQTYVYDELYKQKERIKDLHGTIEKSHELLRLIVQKMEIHTEEEVWDEGLAPRDSFESVVPLSARRARWSTSMAARNMLRQTSVVSRWQKFSKMDSAYGTSFSR